MTVFTFSIDAACLFSHSVMIHIMGDAADISSRFLEISVGNLQVDQFFPAAAVSR